MDKQSSHVSRAPLAARIILPPMLSILLFVIVIYVIFLPALEKRIIATKQQMLRELVETAWKTLDVYHEKEAAGLLTRDQAQGRAMAHLRAQRYGPEKKDYFWITDLQARMVMHPYLTQLEGRDMTDYADPAGNRLVVEMTRIARGKGSGFLEYIWQWRDDPDRLGAKLSYVKKYAPWQWVVGTGIYLEDVAVEVAAVRRQLALVSLGILAVIVVLLSYVVRQSFVINNERRRVLDVLRASEESYRSVMMAVPDPVVVYDIEGRVQYINPAFTRFFGWSLDELAGERIDFVPESCREGTLSKIKETIDHGVCTAFETQRYNRAGDLRDVCVSAANYRDDAGTPLGIVVNLHDISEQKRTEMELVKHREHLEELVKARTAELEESLARVKTLSGLVPICSACKKIRDDQGFWNQIETYVEDHSEALFSHGLCPDCTHDLYKDQSWYRKKRGV